MIYGKTLYTVPRRLIVQSWRAEHWNPEDLDSTLILTFWPEGKGRKDRIGHVNVADHDLEGVNEAWEKYYWKPWRKYLLRKEKAL